MGPNFVVLQRLEEGGHISTWLQRSSMPRHPRRMAIRTRNPISSASTRPQTERSYGLAKCLAKNPYASMYWDKRARGRCALASSVSCAQVQQPPRPLGLYGCPMTDLIQLVTRARLDTPSVRFRRCHGVSKTQTTAPQLDNAKASFLVTARKTTREQLFAAESLPKHHRSI